MLLDVYVLVQDSPAESLVEGNEWWPAEKKPVPGAHRPCVLEGGGQNLACEPAPAHVWCDGHPADAHHLGLNGSD